MTAVEAAVRPTKANVRISRYFAMLVFVFMTRPPKFVAGFIADKGFRFAARMPRTGFVKCFDCFVRRSS